MAIFPMEEDIVMLLKDTPFLKRTRAQQMEIIVTGRPKPTLNGKVGNRSFQHKWYEQLDWLCGSSVSDKLYCWPCLLFHPKSNQSWTDGGYFNFRNILSDSSYHAKSLNHLNNYKCWKTFGQPHITRNISAAAKLERENHNKQVEENRQYLKQLSIAILYLCKQELPLQGHQDKDNYLELINCIAGMDSGFASRLSRKDEPTQISAISIEFQNDLIKAIDKVICHVVRNEIENASFISVQLDAITDCATQSKMSTIIRYVSGYEVHERFWRFDEVNSDKSSGKLVEVVEDVLKFFNDAKNKLVCVTYDGAAVLPGERRAIEVKLREKGFKYSHFVHSYAHRLSFMISKMAENVNGVKMFFSYLSCFSQFSSSNSKRREFLRELGISIPPLNDPSLSYRSGTVTLIKGQREALLKAFETILDNSSKWDEDTIEEVDKLLSKLYDFKFMFVINCLEDILKKADKLSDILESNQLNTEFFQHKMNGFIAFIDSTCNDSAYNKVFEETWKELGHSCDPDSPPRKKSKTSESDYRTTYFQLIENIVRSLRDRFTSIRDFAFLDLINVHKFQEFSENFPTHHISSLQNKYPMLIDSKTLVNELKYIYRDSDFRKCKSANAILELLHEMGLKLAFSETIRLMQLLLTIPATSISNGEGEGGLPTLHRIRSYLRNTEAQNRMSTLARISVEKKVLTDLEVKKELHDKILEEFALKPKKAEFIYNSSTTKQDGKTNQATEQRDSDCRQGPSESSSSIAQSSDSQDIKTEKNEEIYPFVNEGLIPYSTEYLDYNCSSIKQEEDLCSVKSEPLEESEFIPDDQGGNTSAAQPMESSFFQRESSSTLFPAESLSSSMSHQQGETQKSSFSVRKEDRFDHFGKNIAAKLRTLPKDQYIFAEKIITDVLFEAELGNLSRNSIYFKNSKMIHTDTDSLQPERIDRC